MLTRSSTRKTPMIYHGEYVFANIKLTLPIRSSVDEQVPKWKTLDTSSTRCRAGSVMARIDQSDTKLVESHCRRTERLRLEILKEGSDVDLLHLGGHFKEEESFDEIEDGVLTFPLD